MASVPKLRRQVSSDMKLIGQLPQERKILKTGFISTFLTVAGAGVSLLTTLLLESSRFLYIPESLSTVIILMNGVAVITILIAALAFMSYRLLQERKRQEDVLIQRLRTVDSSRLAIATQIVDSLLHKASHESKAR